MNQQAHDITILRDLAQQVMTAAAHPKYAERIRLWTEHNSLQRTRPLVLVSCGRYAAYEYEIIKYECGDPVYRDIEFQLRHKLFKDWIDDDAILHPWVQVRAVFTDPGWGIQAANTPSMQGVEGAYKLAAEPAITPGDAVQRKMRKPRHTIDDAATRTKVLTRKINMLRQLKNLRRIAVTPWADVAACARQIEDKYILSWRPNPAPMVCSGFDPERVTTALREGLAACSGCHTDILLKDIQTVQGEPERLKHWARLAKDIAAENWP